MPTSDVYQGAGALVCVPTYNERENIERIVPETLAAVPQGDLLIIDDNSPDGTGELAEGMARASNRIHVLHRPRKEGLGRAYLAGFAWALARDYRFVFQLDADFSHNPAYLPRFLHALDDCDVVIGSRRVPGGGVQNWGLLRRLISSAGSLYARWVLGVGLRDLTGGFNGYRSSALRTLPLGEIHSTGYCFQIELKYRAVKLGLRVKEVPIVFPDRERGASKMGGLIVAEALVNVLRLRWDSRRWTI